LTGIAGFPNNISPVNPFKNYHSLPKPFPSTGTLLLAVAPFPNCPYGFFPQHLIPPPPARAQVE
jgi:hypothetical protein